ncbi:MAG: thioredoxin-like domain-containing protein [Dysgonomonas sp.]|nr:thioredoxin-like domain-containing protein [Dysgonomonas sp.]
MKYKLLILLSLLFSLEMEAQNNTDEQQPIYKITLDIPSQKNNKIFLGQYWNGATYAIDSVQLTAKGKGFFSIKKELPAGQFFIYSKPAFQIDLLINDNQKKDIAIAIDESNPAKNSVKGSHDTELLWNYLLELDKISQPKHNLEKALADSTISVEKRSDLEKQIEQIDAQMDLYTNSQIAKYEKDWFGIFIKGNTPIKLLHPKPNSVTEYRQNVNYGKEHFFDNIALSDSRIWRTNYIYTYVDSYMNHWIDQEPDSLAYAAKRLVEKTKGNEFAFEKMLSYLANNSLKSKRMGDENTWALLFETYIQDKKLSWITDAQMSELSKMYEYLKENRIGMKAHNLTLQTVDGKEINTNDIEAKYLLLYFYDPSCGHCTSQLPNIHKTYEKFKDKGFKVVTMNIAYDKAKKEVWEKYIKNNKLEDWINCADPEYKSQYWMHFDTSGVPFAYILDKNKKIIARRLSDKDIDYIINFYLGNGTN